MKINIKLLSAIAAIFCVSLSGAYAGLSNTDIPNLTTAKLNLFCNQLLEDKLSKENFDQGLCVGIILGVEDNAHYDKKICVPNNLGLKDRLVVVRDYVSTQPKRMNEAYASLVFDALAQKWPCPSK